MVFGRKVSKFIAYKPKHLVDPEQETKLIDFAEEPSNPS
jgi:hypothetical protein